MSKIILTCLTAAMIVSPASSSAAVLKRGFNNNEVKKIQKSLKDMGYFNYPKATGFFGKQTEKAVIKFQKANGLTPDGIVGIKTKSALKDLTPQVKSAVYTAPKATTSLVQSKIAGVKTKSKANGLLDWYKDVQYIWTRGSDAIVTDVDTGKSFQVKRTYGTNHADVEPLTKKDAQIIKDIWGGWSWERRAVVVTVDDVNIAASMTAMPHAGVESKPANTYVSNRSDGYGRGINLDAVKGNGVSGVMDIHFLNSRTHSTNVKQKVQQNMVKKAGTFLKNEAFAVLMDK